MQAHPPVIIVRLMFHSFNKFLTILILHTQGVSSTVTT